MYFEITRTSPSNSWKLYTQGHWIIGHLSKRQLRWTKNFGYQNHFAVVFITMLRWALLALLTGIVCANINSDIAKNLQVVLPLACLFLAFVNLLISLAACECAESVLSNRQLVVSTRHPSWNLLSSATDISSLRRYEGEQAAVITKFFQDTAEHDKLLAELENDPYEYNRVVEDIRTKAKSLRDEFILLAEMENVMARTQEELAVDGAPFDEVLKDERKAELHERVNQLLNHQPR